MTPAASPHRIDQPIRPQAFDLISLSMACVLALHSPHIPWWLSIALAITLAARWRQRRTPQSVRISRWLKLPALALLTLAVVMQYGTIFGRGPGSALAVGLLILKLLETETIRDARVGISFSCFGLMAALLFNQSIVMTVLVAASLLPVLAAMRALEPGQPHQRLRQQLRPSLLLLLAALPLALLAFLLVPRLDTPLWGASSNAENRAGLSETMSPGGMTEMLTDDHPAMRVSFDGPPPPPEQRYFRAFVMALYDGRSWRYDDLPGSEPAALQPISTASYRIDLEPTRQRVLPTLDAPIDTPDNARMRRDRVVMANKAVNTPISYALSGATQYRLEPELDRQNREWMLLPKGFNPRTLAQGQAWRKRHGDDEPAIVEAALNLFHNGGFRYTLAPAPLGRDAMDDFLFDTHEGYCEHYSSAFTLLMRAAGIPARVVTGYQGGYWNPLGDYLLVRNSDAHAWSEVWLADRGWVRVDPTAAVRPERVTLGAGAAAGSEATWYGGTWLRDVRNRWDVVNRLWNKSVIGFDALRQRGLLTPFGIRNTDTTMLGLLLAISILLFVTIGLTWALARRRKLPPLIIAMRELERKLTRHGVKRRDGEGPKHYLSRAARAMPQQRSTLESLMKNYLELRYAHNEPPTEPLRTFQRAVRDFSPSNVFK